MRAARASQAITIVALFVAGAALAVWAAAESRRSGRLAEFYQDEFAPAVMLACGHGYQNIDWPGHEPLAGFLLQKVDTASCQTLARQAVVPLDAFQRISLYLEYSVAATWRVFGLSWRAIDALYAALGGLVAVSLYGIMRLGVNSALAFAATLMALTSPLHLTYVPELRDYSKVPFLLALVLIMGLIVRHGGPARRLFYLTAAGGLVAGIGLGFRTDVLMLMPPFVVSVLIFRRGDEPSRWRNVSIGARGLALFALTFVVAAWPVLRGYSKGSNIAHVALLGLAPQFDVPLGVETRHYEISSLYLDAYEEAVVREFARRTSSRPSFFLLGSEQYDSQSARYVGRIAATFPADLTIRAIASMIRIIDVGFNESYVTSPSWIRNPVAARLSAFRERAVTRMSGLGLTAAVLVAVGLWCADLRTGFFFVFLTAFLTASGALQFLERHFFYLEFIGWWAVAFAGAEAFKMCLGGVLRRTPPPWLTAARLSRAVTAVIGVSLAGGLFVWSARVYQQRTLNRLFARYLNADSTDLAVTTSSAADGRLLLTPAIPATLTPGPPGPAPLVRAEYLKLEVNSSLCEAVVFDATIRYAATSPAADFTHRIKVPLASETAQSIVILVPVFSSYFTHSHLDMAGKFEGIEIETIGAPCVSAIRRVSDGDVFKVLTMTILSSDWRTAQHYQTLAGVERRYDGAPWTTGVYAPASTRALSRELLARPVESVVEAARYRSPEVRFIGRSGVEMTSRAATPYAYLLQTESRPLQAGRYAVAEGQLFSGGLTFGLLRGQAWYQQTHIRSPGRFVAVAQTLGDGRFGIVLANENDSLIRPTAFRIDKIGWVEPASP